MELDDDNVLEGTHIFRTIEGEIMALDIDSVEFKRTLHEHKVLTLVELTICRDGGTSTHSAGIWFFADDHLKDPSTEDDLPIIDDESDSEAPF